MRTLVGWCLLLLCCLGSLTPLPGTAAAPPEAGPDIGRCGVFFDDFDYRDRSDPKLGRHGWLVRRGNGGPGLDRARWRPAHVDFVGTGHGRSLRLSASVGAGRGVRQAQLSQRDQRVKMGTYAARIRFTDAPVTGADGDQVVQTFYAINTEFPDDPLYSELDFAEYLPNGGWHRSGPHLWLTSWSSHSRNLTTPRSGSREGWHLLTAHATRSTIRYRIDGALVARHRGSGDFDVFPRRRMELSFNAWFNDVDPDLRGWRRWSYDVDWTAYVRGQRLSTRTVRAQVDAWRQRGRSFIDTLGCPS